MLHHLIDAAALRSPHQQFGDEFRVATAVALAQESLGAACELASRGVRAGDRIAVVADNRLEIGVACFAASRLRASAALIPPETPPDRLARLLAELQPTVVLSREADAGSPGRAGFPRLQLESLPRSGRPELVAVDGPARSSDPVLLLYTSGSTALPKAVICPQGSVCFAVEQISRRLGYSHEDRIYSGLAMTFDYGLYQLFLAAASGADLVLRAPGGASDLAAIEEHRCTIVPVLPSLARRLLQQSRRADLRCQSVRLVTNTGAALGRADRDGLRQIFPRTKLVLMFGQTECKRIAISDPDDDLRFPGAAGVALPGTRTCVVDDGGSPVPPGVVGELVVSGPHVMDGYWRDSAATERRFSPGDTGCRVLHTGDYVHLDETGRLYFHGRRDGEFKLRGIRLNAIELEEAAERVPGVSAAAVVGPGGIVPVSLFVEGAISPKTALRGLAAVVGPSKVPPTAAAVATMPTNERGKTDRRALLRMAEASELDRAAAKFGTPLLVYDLDEAARCRQDLGASLPSPHLLYFSVKANPNPALMAGLLDLGCRVEVSSLGELRLARSVSSDPEVCLYTGPGKTLVIPAAIDAGCRWFSVESPAEMAALQAAAAQEGVEVKALLRVNLDAPPAGARLPISGGVSKFGMDLETATELARAPSGPVSLVGLQFFQASNVTVPGALIEMFRQELLVASRFNERCRLDLLDLGGGFPAPYGTSGRTQTPALDQPLSEALRDAFPGWPDSGPKIAFESGRALVASSGTLVCRVTDVKWAGGTRFVLVDSGIHHIGGMFALRRLPRPSLEIIDPLGRPSAGPATVAGPLCTPLDTWGAHELPDVGIGDLLFVRGIGAYGLSASLIGFLSHDPPAELVARNGEIISARRLALSADELR